jgi:hypothetical protein
MNSTRRTGLLEAGHRKIPARKPDQSTFPPFIRVLGETRVGFSFGLIHVDDPVRSIAARDERSATVQVDQLKRPTDWFRVHCLRQLDDPTGKIDRKEMVVGLDQYPHGFSLGPNPRRPDLSTGVSKRIAETLVDDGGNFHHLNRGVTVVAKSIEYDNKTERVRLVLAEGEDEERFFGILDGGNTNARINKWREDLPEEKAKEEVSKRFVNVQVMVPKLLGVDLPTGDMGNLLNDIKEARNTSVQVKEKSLADARRQFDVLKEVLKDEPYFSEISWRQGDPGPIDALLITVLLMIYFPPFAAEAEGGEPSNAYGHKDRCLDAYLMYAQERSEDNPRGCPEELEKWIRILPDILRLFDEFQVTLPTLYTGSFGKIREVQIYDEKKYERGKKRYRKTAAKSQFLGRDMKYSYPVGWLYPIFAAFRVLTGPSPDGTCIVWKKEPVEFWERHGGEICRRYEPHLDAAGFEPKKIATSLICYQAISAAVKDVYKDELLKEAGISL